MSIELSFLCPGYLSLCGNPEVLDDGTLCKDLLKRLEEVVAVYWECTRPQCIRDLKGFSVFLSGGGRRNGQGESVLVCDLMKQWLLCEQVPESCIHIDNSFLTGDAASVRALWRYMQRYECVEKTMVYIVAQAHHALLLENLLQFHFTRKVPIRFEDVDMEISGQCLLGC